VLLNWLTGEVLALEATSDEIRAALVRGSKRRLEIVDFVSLKKEDAEDDLPPIEIIKALAERLHYTGNRAVFVTPMARAFELRMDRVKVSAMKRAQLLEAVKWEAEPYTGISGSNALIGVQYSLKPDKNATQIEFDDQVPITVAAIEQNVFRAVKERFRVAGFKLARIYPPDVTFYMPLLIDRVEIPRAILEVGQDYSNFAIVRGRSPELISTMAMSLDSLTSHLTDEGFSQGLEDSLRFMARQVPAPEPLVISGAGAVDEAVVEYIAGLCPTGARPLFLSRTAGISDTKTEPEHAVFGTVVGAAVRELLGGKEQRLGVNDELTLSERLKKSAYLFPVVVTALTLTLLLGHYVYMRHKETVYKKRIETLSSDIKERKNKMEEYEKLNKELEKVNKEAAIAGKKLAFATGQADVDLLAIRKVVQEIGAAVPDKIILISIKGSGTGSYNLFGAAAGQGGVGRYMSAIQDRYWCEAVQLTKVERKGNTHGFLTFQLEIKTRNSRGVGK
jgi:Tfp pilus assembly protein PilN/chorismate mutase